MRVQCTLLLGILALACGPQNNDPEPQEQDGDSSAMTPDKLPDGTSCKPAPGDVSGARASWQRFLDWHAANAAICGNRERWPSYECWIRAADPRTVRAFTDCMTSDGCSSISNEDACAANPENPGVGYQLSGTALAWYQNVCLPKSLECGFSNDVCGVFSPVLRPELRCATVDCLAEGSCDAVRRCLNAVRTTYAICDG